AFTISSSEGLEKGYDRFQQLLSQLEAYGAEVSIEDANYKFLRSLPSACKSSTNKVKSGHTGPYSTYTPSTSLNNIPEREVPAGFADEIDDVDIEEMDINWQIVMIAIRMKKFYKKTERRVRINLECTSKGINDGKKRDSFYQDQGAGKKEQNQNCLMTMDDGVVNWGEKYSRRSEQEAKILAYNQAVKKLEAQIVTFQKQQLSLNEQLTFQANELYEKDEKLKKYRRIGMKAVKEKEQLQKTVDSWKDSSKNLWKLVNSGMTSNSKVDLGYGIKSNNGVLSYGEEMNLRSFGNTSEHSVEFESENISVPKEVFESKSVTTNEKVVSEPKPKEVKPSCVTHVKTPRQPVKNQETPKVNRKNWNEMMKRELGEDDSDMPELTIFNKPQKGIFDEASYDARRDSQHSTHKVKSCEIINLVQIKAARVQQHSGAHALEEPKKISEALKDDSWVEAMQEELLQNKRDERGVVVRNKARLVAQGHRQEEVLTMMRFLLLWQELKLSDEEVYVSQPPSFVDPDHPKKVYKVVKALYGLHQAPRAWYATLSTFLETHGYRRGTIDKTLFIKKDKKYIMLRFPNEFLVMLIFLPWNDKSNKKTDGTFHFSSKTNPQIGTPTLMYLTASRPDIMFAVCACSCFQVTPKTSHLNVVKRIFKYLKGKPNLGLWYPREPTFDLEAYSDSDYAGANLDRKSTTGGYQFLGSKLISWQCKKQTIVATSTTKAEYVATASYCGQVLWIQNQMLDYGFNFMNTKIHIDNESTICIVKNPVYHSKTKHIEIRHHFIRDSYEKKLIRVEKIHTDFNVADLLTKAFDGPMFNLLVVNIGYTWIARRIGAWIRVELKLCKS
ncbi:putative ribonuclease H-like domain-containing protein, partial [Tanacetum coccineum]